MVWALIMDGHIINLVVASLQFISTQTQYDKCVNVTGLDPRPKIGDRYNSITNGFTPGE